MEWWRRRISDVRCPDGMTAKNSGCEASEWNDSEEEFRMRDIRMEWAMSRVARGPSACAGERKPRDIFLGRTPQIGESLERETSLVGCTDMEAWVNGFNGYAKE